MCPGLSVVPHVTFTSSGSPPTVARAECTAVLPSARRAKADACAIAASYGTEKLCGLGYDGRGGFFLASCPPCGVATGRLDALDRALAKNTDVATGRLDALDRALANTNNSLLSIDDVLRTHTDRLDRTRDEVDALAQRQSSILSRLARLEQKQPQPDLTGATLKNLTTFRSCASFASWLARGMPSFSGTYPVTLCPTDDLSSCRRAKCWVKKERHNVALRKPTAQRSTCCGGVSSRAVDGNTNGVWTGQSVTHTQRAGWWRVDLQQVYEIAEIRVNQRTDCCHTRADTAYIYTSNTFNSNPGSPNGPKIKFEADNYSLKGGLKTWLNSTAGLPVKARWVTAVNTREYLSLAEVQVFIHDVTSGETK